MPCVLYYMSYINKHISNYSMNTIIQNIQIQNIYKYMFRQKSKPYRCVSKGVKSTAIFNMLASSFRSHTLQVGFFLIIQHTMLLQTETISCSLLKLVGKLYLLLLRYDVQHCYLDIRFCWRLSLPKTFHNTWLHWRSSCEILLLCKKCSFECDSSK